jgi:hypothetical protein
MTTPIQIAWPPIAALFICYAAFNRQDARFRRRQPDPRTAARRAQTRQCRAQCERLTAWQHHATYLAAVRREAA